MLHWNPTLTRAQLLRLAAGSALIGAALHARRVRGGGGLRIRKNIIRLTAEEKRRFVEAVKGLKRLRSSFDPSLSAYDYYVRLHLTAYYLDEMPAHMAPAFAPWHRWFLLLVENDLQRLDPTVTIPYWDWTAQQDPRGLPWTDDLLGPNGNPAQGYVVTSGPFRPGEWTLHVIDPESQHYDPNLPYLQRDFGTYISGGAPQTTLPTAAQVSTALSMPVYDVAPWDAMSNYAVSFRNYLEGFRRTPDGGRLPAEMHNRVHNWIGGSMSEGSSPNDPAFFLHHAFIDLLWSQWLELYGRVYLPLSGARFHQNLHDPLWGFPEVTPAMLLDHQALGYVYDRELA